jgi:phenylacetate-coenzyme A ligase PaaK-like adenylate-forming protein
VRPFDFYATTEGLYGTVCREGSMHLFDDLCVVENVDDDGRPVAPGEVGSRLLVTNLFNRVQPLIRFEVTDLVSIEPEPCPCGRSLMRLRSLEGRAEEVLRLGGVTVHPLQFALVTADPDVREFQVVQVGDGLRLRVAARRSGRCTGKVADARGRSAAGARSGPARRGGGEVDALERSSGGKLQMVVAART